jgi:hypothetical protein
VRLVLPVGRYLVRRFEGQSSRSREVSVEPGRTVRVDEESLTLSAAPALVSKRFVEPPAGSLTTPRANTCQIDLRVGQSFNTERSTLRTSLDLLDTSLSGATNLRCTIGERLLYVPSDLLLFGYRLGDRSGWELVPLAGLSNVGVTKLVNGDGAATSYGLQLEPELELSARRWLGGFDSLDLHVELFGHGQLGPTRALREPFNTWTGSASIGFTHGLLDLATLHAALGWSGRLHSGPGSPVEPGAKLVLGSVQTVGYQLLPLVRVHVVPWLSLDGFASLSFDLHGGPTGESFLLGLSGEFQ